jgi:hypothetical protein
MAKSESQKHYKLLAPHYPGKIQVTLEKIVLKVVQNNYGNKIPCSKSGLRVKSGCSFLERKKNMMKLLLAKLMIIGD